MRSLSNTLQPLVHPFTVTLRRTGVVALLLALGAGAAPGQTPSTATFTTYHGWSNSVSVNNGLVEALIVPTIGRVQQFRFVGQDVGALWEDPATYGQNPGGRYKFFGGDRAWPSPQSEFGWPPPRGFDGSTNEVSFTNGVVTMVSPVDTRFGIRSTRIIELLPGKPVVRIRTRFERITASSKTNNLGIWVDCMAAVTNDSRCYAPVPSPSIFANGYTTSGSTYFTAALPAGFTNVDGMISFVPDGKNHKLGFDGGTLALVGKNLSLRVDAPRVPGAAYPDGNSSTEVYTAESDFELEMMGPLGQLPVGGQMEFVTEYNLFHRTEPTTDAEAKKVFAWHY